MLCTAFSLYCEQGSSQ